MYKTLAVVSLLAAAECWNQFDNANYDMQSIIKSITNTSFDPGQATAGPPPASPTPTIQPSTLAPRTLSKDIPVACETDSGQKGFCVTKYQCDDKSKIKIDGMDIIDIRNADKACPGYFDMCCVHPRSVTTTPPPSTPKYSCGVRNIKGVGFGTTGDINKESKFGEFPYMVALLKIVSIADNDPDSRKLHVYVGGGSLIHPSIVLTAAHTVARVSELSVRAGEWDTQTSKEIFRHQEREVKEVVVHNDFNGGNLFYDIALLFLKKPVELAEHIGVACLPRAGERAEHGERCQTSGWGKDLFGKKGQYQVILKRTEVPIVNRDKCQEQLRNTRLGWYYILHSTFMCAGGETSKDACTGDGGSPLVCPMKYVRDRYVQYGIVAWGLGCGEADIPGVYVDVANFRPWIDEKVTARGYDPKVYTY